MKNRLLNLIMRLFYLVAFLLMPVMLLILMSILRGGTEIKLGTLINSLLADGTLITISLVLASLGMYNLGYKLRQRRRIYLLTIMSVMGIVLIMLNIMIFMFIKDQQFSIEMNFRNSDTIQIVTVLVSIIWFVTIEFILENERNDNE